MESKVNNPIFQRLTTYDTYNNKMQEYKKETEKDLLNVFKEKFKRI